jgi:hypothetical protein
MTISLVLGAIAVTIYSFSDLQDSKKDIIQNVILTNDFVTPGFEKIQISDYNFLPQLEVVEMIEGKDRFKDFNIVSDN